MNDFDEARSRSGEGGGPDLRLLFVRGIARSWAWVLALVLLGAVVGAGVGLLQPNLYSSTAKLVLRMGTREQLTAESLLELEDRQRVPPPTMLDELQLLSDADILENVVAELGPARVLAPGDPRRDDGPHTPLAIRLLHRLQSYAFGRLADAAPPQAGDELRAAVKHLRATTTVLNEPGTSVIVVTNVSTSPELAQTIVGELVDSFIDRHRLHFSIEPLLERSRSQLSEARLARDAAATAYAAQVFESGLVELETQIPQLETDLAALEDEVFEARVRREEIARTQASLTNRLEGSTAEIVVQTPRVMVPNEEYETRLALKRLLLAQKQEMLIVERESEETRRREREYDRQIEKLEEHLSETPRHVVQGTELQENLRHSEMQDRLVDLQVEDEALAVKSEVLKSRLDADRAHVGELQKQLLAATMLRDELASVLDAETARLSGLLEYLSVLETLQSMDANGESNLRVLQAPTLELEKVGPRRGTLLLKGLLAGLILACSFAVLRQHFDPRLRYPEAAQHTAGAPVLAVVPHLRALRRLGRVAPHRGD